LPVNEISLGLKHYLLILTPSLIDELNDFGLELALGHPGLKQHDIEKAFFAARAITHRLPAQPDLAEPALWLDIMDTIHAVRVVLEPLEKETFDAVAEQAAKATSEIARADMKQMFEEKKAKGEVDFRLYSLSQTKAEPGVADPAVQESLHIKRARRHETFISFNEHTLRPNEQVIMQDAKALLHRITEERFADERIDALLALGTVMMETASVRVNTGVPDVIREKFDRMTGKAAMALGALVYRDEYQRLKDLLDLPSLDSDL
jgi:hypothetical protein